MITSNDVVQVRLTHEDFPLVSNYNLQPGTYIKLGKFGLVVGRQFIYQSGGSNIKNLFKELKISDTLIRSQCGLEYGYNPGDGDFPEYKTGDMTAARNILNYLYNYCLEMGVIDRKKSVKVSKQSTYTDFIIKDRTLRVYGNPLYQVRSKKNDVQQS